MTILPHTTPYDHLNLLSFSSPLLPSPIQSFPYIYILFSLISLSPFHKNFYNNQEKKKKRPLSDWMLVATEFEQLQTLLLSIKSTLFFFSYLLSSSGSLISSFSLLLTLSSYLSLSSSFFLFCFYLLRLVLTTCLPLSTA